MRDILTTLEIAHQTLKMNNTLPNILAISGSLRANSSNNAVIRLAKEKLNGKANVIIYDGLGSLPHFNDSKEVPDTVNTFRTLLQVCDGVLICSPEYAFGVPGSLKNALDWTVSSGEFVQKPLALITAATGGDKAHAALLQTFTALSAKMVENGSLLLPFIRSKMNAEGEIVNPETIHQIEQTALALVNNITSNN